MAEPITPATLDNNPQPATSAEGGSADLVADFMTDLAGSKPAETAVVVEPTKTEGATAAKVDKLTEPADAAKVAPKPQAAPAKPVAPAPKPAPVSKPIDIDDPKVPAAELRKHLKEVQSKFTQTIAEKEASAMKLQTRLAELEKKRYWSEDDEKEVAAKTQRLSQLEADIYGRDYTQSPEFKKNFQDKIDNQFKEAIDVFSALQIYENDSQRAANPADVNRILNAPNNAERRKLAKEMFPEDFQEVLDAVHPMLETRRAAEQAVKEKSENYQSESKKKSDEQREQSAQMSEIIKQQTSHLAEKYPDVWAAKDDDQESKDLLKKGFDFVDESSSKQSMDINERAARTALIRSWAGAFPRLFTENGKLKSQIAELQSEIEKYRATDPANAGDGAASGGGSNDSTDKGGVDELAAEIDKLNLM